jgi:transposase
MYFIGGDIHKTICTFNVMNAKLKTVEEFIDVPTNEEGFRCITRNYNPKDCYILIESSTRTNFVQRFFHHAGYTLITGHAKDLKKINQSRAKTDRIDARKLAEYAKEYYEWEKHRPTDENGRPIRPPFRISRMTDLSEYMERNMTRQVMRLSSLGAEYKRSIQEYMSAQDIQMPYNYRTIDAQRSIDYLKEYPDPALNIMASIMEQTIVWQDELTDELKELLENNEDVKLLMTIPGIDFRTASYFAMQIRDVSAFEDAESLVCYFGLAPKVSMSANKYKSGQPIVRESDSRLRRAVYDAVRSHVRSCKNSAIAHFEARMVSRIGVRKAEAAAGRKLVVVMWTMLTYREPFRPHPIR